MLNNDQVVWLHVEPTSRCNAHCPACPRNNFGFGVVDGLSIQDLSIKHLSNAFDKFKNIHSVQFCGNYGDPIAAKNINEQIEFVLSKNVKRIQIHTNGSLKTEQWWSKLAKTLSLVSEGYVEFAIDGLEDTHSIYRQGTNFNKIIENAKAFIAAGGNAHWQFIPFKHNEHQIKDCIRLSQQLGFKKFNFVRNARYYDQSYHYKTKEKISILPWNKDSEYNHLSQKNKKIVHIENCMHLNYPSVFISATGQISPCCYLSEVPIDKIDIGKDFKDSNFHNTCLKNCGSCL